MALSGANAEDSLANKSRAPAARATALAIPRAMIVCLAAYVAVRTASMHVSVAPQSVWKKMLAEKILWSAEMVESAPCAKDERLPEHWCLDDIHRVPRYVGNRVNDPGSASMAVRHFTHKGYENCLAGKTVVFIGESRVRYQFMHLVSFLHRKRFMKCEDQAAYLGRPHGVDPECYLITKQHSDWNTYYKESARMLGARNLCDCYRHTPPRPISSFENRFVKRRTPHGEINLIYLQSLVNQIRVDRAFPPYSPFFGSAARCHAGECGPGNRTNAFNGKLLPALDTLLPALNATHAFVNLSWEGAFGGAAQSTLSCALRERRALHPRIELYLISHPPKREGSSNASASSFDARELRCEVGVLDRTRASRGVDPSWYWDDVHVLSILNEEYNHQMVETICPI